MAFSVAVLFSGGKDSTLAAFWAVFQGFNVVLITVKSGEDSWMFHRPNVEWTPLQAQAMELPHVMVEAKNENELEVLKHTLAELRVEGIVSGALASEYQRERIERIGDDLGIPTFAPLWHKDKPLVEMWREMDVRLVSVSAEGLGREELLKPFPRALPYGCHPFLEGGEGETFVLDAPFFSKKIVIDDVEIAWDGVRGVAWIRKAHLEEK